MAFAAPASFGSLAASTLLLVKCSCELASTERMADEAAEPDALLVLLWSLDEEDDDNTRVLHGRCCPWVFREAPAAGAGLNGRLLTLLAQRSRAASS